MNPDRPSNLFEPVGGGHGAHGIFDSRAHEMSIELWETTHRGWLAAAGTAGVLGWKLLKNKRTEYAKSPSERKTGTYD